MSKPSERPLWAGLDLDGFKGHPPGPWKACTPCHARTAEDPDGGSPCGLVWSLPADAAIACIRREDDDAGISMGGPARLAAWDLIAAAPALLAYALECREVLRVIDGETREEAASEDWLPLYEASPTGKRVAALLDTGEAR